MPVVAVLPLLAAPGLVPLLVELPLFSGIAASPALDAPPAWANAKVDDSAKAPANKIVLSFIRSFLIRMPQDQNHVERLYVPSNRMVDSQRRGATENEMRLAG
jgi:hypothetical protein